MDQAEQRRLRLAQLLDLAQTYQGCTRKALARTLGRDPTKLIPGSGVPKLDLVVDLSRVLDWSVDDVVEFLWVEDEPKADAFEADADYEALDKAAGEAYRSGRFRLMIDLAKRAREVATTGAQRARAGNREAGGWDGLGRFQNILPALQGALQEHPVDADVRRMLQSNLANTYYCLWSLVEARALAAELIHHYKDHPPDGIRDRRTQAYAYYVSGNTYRRLITQEPGLAKDHATAALTDLEVAGTLYRNLARELEDHSYDGIANTCDGGIIEAEVVLERRSAKDAIATLTAGLDHVQEAVDNEHAAHVESYGWWSIFGCNIALRSLSDEHELQQRMAVFTNKADEIAEHLDNWAIRERVFTMDHSRWERARGCTGFDIPRVVDDDDVRIITGTMARFPTFRDTGWRILESAKVIRSN